MSMQLDYQRYISQQQQKQHQTQQQSLQQYYNYQCFYQQQQQQKMMYKQLLPNNNTNNTNTPNNDQLIYNTDEYNNNNENDQNYNYHNKFSSDSETEPENNEKTSQQDSKQELDGQGAKRRKQLKPIRMQSENKPKHGHLYGNKNNTFVETNNEALVDAANNASPNFNIDKPQDYSQNNATLLNNDSSIKPNFSDNSIASFDGQQSKNMQISDSYNKQFDEMGKKNYFQENSPNKTFANEQSSENSFPTAYHRCGRELLLGNANKFSDEEIGENEKDNEDKIKNDDNENRNEKSSAKESIEENAVVKEVPIHSSILGSQKRDNDEVSKENMNVNENDWKKEESFPKSLDKYAEQFFLSQFGSMNKDGESSQWNESTLIDGIPAKRNKEDDGKKNGKILHPEAYCELCDREFCNKYFLKRHRTNKHGIVDQSDSPSLPSLTEPPPPHLWPMIFSSKMNSSSLVFPEFLPNEKASNENDKPSSPSMKTSQDRSVSCSSAESEDEDSENQKTKKLKLDNSTEDDNLKKFPNEGDGKNGQGNFQNTPPMNDFKAMANLVLNFNPFMAASMGFFPPAFINNKGNSLDSIADKMKADFDPKQNFNDPSDPMKLLKNMNLFNQDFLMGSYRKDFLNNLMNKSPKNNPSLPGNFFMPGAFKNGFMGNKPSVFDNLDKNLSSERFMKSHDNKLSTTPTNIPPSSLIHCDICKKSLPSRHALNLHMVTSHNLFRPLLPFMEGSGMDFSTKSRGKGDGFGSNTTSSGSSKLVDRVQCDICQKEVCNKYFLKTHKIKVHGCDPASLEQPDERGNKGHNNAVNANNNSNNSNANNITNNNAISTSNNIPNNTSNNSNNNTSFNNGNNQQQIQPLNFSLENNSNEPINNSGNNAENQVVEKPREEELLQMGIDPEAYCEICKKEFCNKYFLKTHKQNIHGIKTPSSSSSSSNNSSTPSHHPSSFKPDIMQLSRPLPMDQPQFPLIPGWPLGYGNPPNHSPNSSNVMAAHLNLLTGGTQLNGGSNNPNNPSSNPNNVNNNQNNIMANKNFFPGIRPINPLLSGSHPFFSTFNPLFQFPKDTANPNHSSNNINSSNNLSQSPNSKLVNSTNGTNNDNSNDKKNWKWKEPVNAMRVMCEICNKVLCNKYFLKTHMIKRHGLNYDTITGQLSSAMSNNNPSTPTSKTNTPNNEKNSQFAGDAMFKFGNNPLFPPTPFQSSMQYPHLFQKFHFASNINNPPTSNNDQVDLKKQLLFFRPNIKKENIDSNNSSNSNEQLKNDGELVSDAAQNLSADQNTISAKTWQVPLNGHHENKGNSNNKKGYSTGIEKDDEMNGCDEEEGMKTSSFQCDQCNETFNTAISFHLHLLSKHNFLNNNYAHILNGRENDDNEESSSDDETGNMEESNEQDADDDNEKLSKDDNQEDKNGDMERAEDEEDEDGESTKENMQSKIEKVVLSQKNCNVEEKTDGNNDGNEEKNRFNGDGGDDNNNGKNNLENGSEGSVLKYHSSQNNQINNITNINKQDSKVKNKMTEPSEEGLENGVIGRTTTLKRKHSSKNPKDPKSKTDGEKWNDENGKKSNKENLNNNNSLLNNDNKFTYAVPMAMQKAAGGIQMKPFLLSESEGQSNFATSLVYLPTLRKITHPSVVTFSLTPLSFEENA